MIYTVFTKVFSGNHIPEITTTEFEYADNITAFHTCSASKIGKKRNFSKVASILKKIVKLSQLTKKI